MFVALFLLTLLSTADCSAETFYGTNVESEKIPINPKNLITVVIYSNEDLQKETRHAAQYLDEFQGLPCFRQVILVDFRGSFGTIFKDLSKDVMRSNTRKEAERIRPFCIQNGYTDDPQKILFTLPDFEGKLSKQLGWTKPLKELSVIIFDKTGQEVKRWESLKNYAELKELSSKLLKTQKE